MASKIKALIADDSKLIRQLEVSALKGMGIDQIEMAVDGEEAMLKLNAKQFDLLILDWTMPKKNGYEVASEVRKEGSINKGIKILMVTAEASKDKVLQIARVGVNGYIVKPFTAETIQSKVSILFKG
jgi:two-component system chemotaxis response regulator CheY